MHGGAQAIAAHRLGAAALSGPEGDHHDEHELVAMHASYLTALRGQAVAATATVTEQTAVGADILVDVQLAEVCSPSFRCFETQLTYRRRVTR